jgi:hypothetical protein
VPSGTGLNPLSCSEFGSSDEAEAVLVALPVAVRASLPRTGRALPQLKALAEGSVDFDGLGLADQIKVDRAPPVGAQGARRGPPPGRLNPASHQHGRRLGRRSGVLFNARVGGEESSYPLLVGLALTTGPGKSDT